MKPTWKAGAVAALLAVLIPMVFVAAQESALKIALVKPADLQFVRMYNGTYQANVVGDITKVGTYAVRTKLPAGLRIQPHFHAEARIALVMSGTLYVGFGERFDELKLTALPEGSVFFEPTKQPHFTWAKDEEVILHVTGDGPTTTTWMEKQPERTR